MAVISMALSGHDSPTARDSSSNSVNGGTANVISMAAPSQKDLQFWEVIFASIRTCLFLSALGLPSVSIAPPTIAYELQAS